MKIKYAIYKNKIGLRATEYADTKRAIKHFPYINEKDLPVIINNVGGYTSFDLDREKEHGFLKIIEIEEDQEPLTREDRYPKNVAEFEYGWLSPDGDTYNTGYEGHCRAADAICEELGFNSYRGEYQLEEKGWVKITANWQNGSLKKAVYVNNLYITKKQSDTLFDLGLWDMPSVQSMIHHSERTW